MSTIIRVGLDGSADWIQDSGSIDRCSVASSAGDHGNLRRSSLRDPTPEGHRSTCSGKNICLNSRNFNEGFLKFPA